jgi:hypothetical protein
MDKDPNPGFLVDAGMGCMRAFIIRPKFNADPAGMTTWIAVLFLASERTLTTVPGAL